MSFLRRGASRHDAEDSWISVSDLMAGLMVIFLFIAISYIRPVLLTQDQIKRIAVAWETSKTQIYDALNEEFQGDLPKWGAELEKSTLIIRFRSPEILFDLGEPKLKDRFKEILADFVPRYLDVLARYRTNIEEIRIEGHTSPEWASWAKERLAYFKNMELSQQRTRAVLQYALTRPGIEDKHPWARALITANGLSSSKPIMSDGGADMERSRRVDFRIRTDAEKQIEKVLRTVK